MKFGNWRGEGVGGGGGGGNHSFVAKERSSLPPSKKAIINHLHTASHFRPGKLNRVAKQGYFFLSLSSIYFSKKIDISKICAYTGHK